ncbi:MAG TPA: RNA polymerase sigma factor [Actinocrinis sp.]|nr:RNA polymerase sigma factor [Actinocrinis sp.]
MDGTSADSDVARDDRCGDGHMNGGWDDSRLVRLAQQGDQAAINALVCNAHPHVTRFAYTLCASPQDAEDAAQEAVIILFRKIGTLRATAALASWMFRIVRHECLRLSRKAIASSTSPWSQELDGDLAESAEDRVLRQLETERLAAAVAELPPVQRSVLIMRDIQGLSGRATADALGLSVPAMKSHLHRARTQMNTLLTASR